MDRRAYDKGFEYLVEAVCSLPSADHGVVVVGDGPLRAELEDLSNASGAKVVFAGTRSGEELDALFARAAVLCLPSVERAEMFGMVQLEAFARGVPVVTTNISRSGVALVGVEGKTGLVVPPRDPAALAAAIRTITSNPRVRREMGSSARKLFRRCYSIEQVTNRFVALYDDLVDGSSRTSSAMEDSQTEG